MGLGSVSGLNELLHHCLLLIGEVNARTRESRHLADRVIERLAQHGGGTAKIHLQRSGHVEGHLLCALEVVPGDIGKGKKPGGDIVENGLVPEDGLALQLAGVCFELVEVVAHLVPGGFESGGHLSLGPCLCVRILQSHHPQRSERSRHFEGERLADAGEFLLQLAEALFHLIGLLLELV